MWGAIKAVQRTSQDLESTEIRRQKIECLVALNGLRFVIADGVTPPDEYKSKFMYEMNKIPSLWAGDPEVMENLRAFHSDRTNERFILLLRNLGCSTKLPTKKLTDADFRTVSLLPLSGR